MSTDKTKPGSHIEPTDSTTAVSDAVKTRRKLLKGTLAGAGVTALIPEGWVNPVINTVVLPAHSQTSPDPGPGGSPTSPPVTTAPSTTVPATTVPATTVPATTVVPTTVASTTVAATA